MTTVRSERGDVPEITKKKSKFSVKKTRNPGLFRPELKVEYFALEDAMQELTPGGFRAWVRLHLVSEVFYGRKILAQTVLLTSRSQGDYLIRELRLKGYLWVSERGCGPIKTAFKLVRRAIIPRKTLFMFIAPTEMARESEKQYLANRAKAKSA